MMIRLIMFLPFRLVNYYEVPELIENSTYFWKVVAIDDDGGETTSNTWTFWTNSENSSPSEFTLLTPEEGEETVLTPTFTWTESTDEDLYDVVGYTLKYGTDPTDLDLVMPFESDEEINYSLSLMELMITLKCRIFKLLTHICTMRLLNFGLSRMLIRCLSEEGFQEAHLFKKVDCTKK